MSINTINKANSFEKGALILVIANLIAKVLGALYRIPLTNILGVEGIGLYQVIIPTLLLALALTSNYIPITLSKCIAYVSDGTENEESAKLFKSTIKYVIAITIIISLIIFVIAKGLAIIQKHEELTFCYILLIPTIILSGIKNVYRGWFYGFKNMLFPSISQLIEQILKIGTSLTLAWLGLKYSLIYAVFGAVVGLLAGEVVGFMFLFIVKQIKKTSVEIQAYDQKLYYKLLFTESSPIMVSGIIFPIISFIDSFLIIILLTSFGNTANQAISEYGLLQGPVYSLINLPIMIAISFSLAIIPLLSSLYAKREVKTIKEKSSMSIKLCFAMIMPACLGLCIIAKPTLMLLYPRLTIDEINFCVLLLVYSSINIITLSLLEIINSILQGLSQAKFAAKSLILGAIIKIVIEIILTSYIGIYGVVISNISFYIIALLLSSSKYQSLLGNDLSLLQNIGKIVACSVIMALAIYFSIFTINNSILKIAVGVFVGVIVYTTLVLITKVFSIKELNAIPGGKNISKVFHYGEEITND